MRTCLITGSSGGIGGALVRVFAKDGWSVIGVDRREPPPGLPLDRYVAADITADGEVERLVVDLGLEALSALVNNAAVGLDRPLIDTSDGDWDQVMAANVRAPFQLIRETAGLLRDARGAVVNIASVHAIATSANTAAYAVSKGALVALTRSAAIELGPDGIRCNALVPGAVDTPLLRAGLGRRAHPEGADGNLAELRRRTPLGFVAEPEAIAEAALFLADGGRSAYVTGQTLVADGGALAHLSTE